ncbi:MAG: hypothetical protein GC180_09300 [Bacteroidetes bacterium]|nr:hypothetical protein [Bacteroidota bacterium]
MVVLNCLAVLYQEFYPKESVELLKEYYFSDARSVNLSDSLDWYGTITRKTGVFFTPLYLSAFSLYTAFFFASLKKWRWFGAAAVLGIFTLSKAYYIGLILLLLYSYYRLVGKGTRAFLILPWVGLVAAIFIGPIFSSILENAGYSGFADLISKGYSSRYDASNHDLLNYETIRSIESNPWIGYGFQQPDGIFLGDTFWVDTLYRGGIIGLILSIFVLRKYISGIFNLSLVLIIASGLSFNFTTIMLPILLYGNYRLNHKSVDIDPK